MSNDLPKSFLDIEKDSDFPLQNLPYGVYRRLNGTQPPRVCVGIGDWVLDLAVIEGWNLFRGDALKGKRVFNEPNLNKFIALGRPAWKEAREVIFGLLWEDVPTLSEDQILRERALIPREEVEMVMPIAVSEFTDFYSSRDHARNVGTMLRGPENALNPNWSHLPVAYHGRASSVVISGTPITRPKGQRKLEGLNAPAFGPSTALDFEAEVAIVMGPGNSMGESIDIANWREHAFGLVLLNDWSARDIQGWEYVPLGPFLAKNFASSISPWVIPFDALEPFQADAPPQDPEPLEYLRQAGKRAFDIHIEVLLQTPRMDAPHRIALTNTRNLYWSFAQQIAHHTVNGCPLRPGDLLGSGTISGPTPESLGCLLELAWKGTRPVALPDGDARIWLEDGDRVILRAWCEGNGYRIGFGECEGTILPARP